MPLLQQVMLHDQQLEFGNNQDEFQQMLKNRVDYHHNQ